MKNTLDMPILPSLRTSMLDPTSRVVEIERRPAEKAGPGSGAGAFRGELTTKFHMLADALGRPLRFIVAAGQAGDCPQAAALLDGQPGRAVFAD